MTVSRPEPTPVPSDSAPGPHPPASVVTLEPFRRSSPVYGQTDFQALGLAFSYLRTVLQNQADSGWVFFLEQADPEPFDPVEYFFGSICALERSAT